MPCKRNKSKPAHNFPDLEFVPHGRSAWDCTLACLTPCRQRFAGLGNGGYSFPAGKSNPPGKSERLTLIVGHVENTDMGDRAGASGRIPMPDIDQIRNDANHALQSNG